MIVLFLRRAAVAFVGIALSALLLRPQISSALVVRGDDLNYRGNAESARRLWQRAISWDANDREAVDRLCFSEIMSHSPEMLAKSVATATAYLARHRDDSIVLADRALAFELLKKFSLAEADFSRAGKLTRDPQTLTFGGFAALHAGDRIAARRLFTEATRVDARYVPALRGLKRAHD